MKTYPIMLDVRGRLAVVVGGGAVGLRKVRSLTAAGARVRLVARETAPDAEADDVSVIRESYRGEHLAGAMLVFACTDDRDLNARVARDARAIGAMVNAADQSEDCDFYLPAVVADGDVVVAIGTGGASPALAANLKERVAAALPEGTGEFAGALAQVRDRLKDTLPDARRRSELLRQLADPAVFEAFRSGGADAIQRKLDELLRKP